MSDGWLLGVLIIGLSFLVVFWSLRLWMALYVVCGWNRRLFLLILFGKVQLGRLVNRSFDYDGVAALAQDDQLDRLG